MRKVGYLRDNEELVVKDGVVYAKEKFNIYRWAAEIITNTYHGNVDFYCCDPARTVVAYNIYSRLKPGIAICHKDDKYNREVGKAIALCRLKGIKIPKEVFED